MYKQDGRTSIFRVMRNTCGNGRAGKWMPVPVMMPITKEPLIYICAIIGYIYIYIDVQGEAEKRHKRYQKKYETSTERDTSIKRIRYIYIYQNLKSKKIASYIYWYLKGDDNDGKSTYLNLRFKDKQGIDSKNAHFRHELRQHIYIYIGSWA